MRKVVIKISQGSVVTQTVLGGLTIHLPVANFLCFICAKNYEIWLRVEKVIAMNTVSSFFGPPCILHHAVTKTENNFGDINKCDLTTSTCMLYRLSLELYVLK